MLVITFGSVRAETKGPVLGASKTSIGTAYLVSIGVNTSQGALICNYCLQDAEAMINRFRTDTTATVRGLRNILGLDEFSLEAYNHSGAEASLKSLSNTFNMIAAKAQKNDLIVVYYAGISMFEFGEEGFNRLENHFYLKKDSATGISEYFTIAQLKIWLDRIAAQNMMMISDAGPTDSYISDFLENLTTIKSDWKLIDQKNRFFIFPESNGMDDYKNKRGYFSQTITMLPAPYSIADLTNENYRRYIENQCYQVAMTLCGNRIDISANRVWFPNVFSEKEFLKKYGTLFEPDGDISRGGTIDEIEEESVKPQTDGKPRSRALLIGIDRYDYWNGLNNPVLDAASVAELLHNRYGFDTTILRNPTYEEIVLEIIKLSREDLSGPADQLLIFFAGHGYFDDFSGSGFLVAKDSKPPKNNPTCTGYIPHNYLINILNNLPCPHITLIVDACYSGSIQKDVKINEEECFMDIPIKWDNLYEGITSMDFINRSMSCPTRRYLTSGGKGYKVPDGYKGKHSPFAGQLIEILKKVDDSEGLITFTEVNSKMQKVINPQPRYGRFGKDAETSEFLFLKKKTP